MQHRLLFQPLHEAVRSQFVIIRPAQMRTHRFERHQEALKIRVPVQRLDFGQSSAITMALAEFEQRRGIDRSLQMQMQLRFRKLTDKGVGRAV